MKKNKNSILIPQTMKKYTILLLLLLTSAFAFSQIRVDEGKPETDKDILLANEYFSQGEFEKAITIYAELAKEDSKIERIHKNYFASMLKLEEYKQAEKYFKKLLKSNPDKPLYQVDFGLLLKAKGEEDKMMAHYDDFLEEIRGNDNQLKNSAVHFMDVRLFEYAEKAYLLGQKNRRQEFGFELGELYYNWGKNDKMLTAYFDLLKNMDAELDEIEVSTVQGILQDRLEEEDFDSIEPKLFEYVQKYPGRLIYNEMLTWFYLQKKKFYKAFLQAKAIDKRKDSGGFEILKIGQLAQNNKEFGTAVKIYQYLVDKYSKKPVYGLAKNKLIQSKEEVVKRSYPVDMEQIKSLVAEYQNSISEFGIRRNTADAVRSLAKLNAFYLNNRDTAIAQLTNFVTGRHRGISQYVIDEAKLDLGDIYLLKNEPWESTLIYAQVEKSQKDRPLGHDAKLRNAKLSYYRGDFDLAKAHLDVLKLATSREIANDAMDLSLLIQDNLELDTSEIAMQKYANIDLLLFQNQYPQALEEYGKMLKNFPKHSLIDNIYWEMANIQIKLGNTEKAVEALTEIMTNHGDDILGDDATFLLAKQYEEKLADKEKAKELYLKILTDYPGSIYIPEARKRARLLRGDKL
jgi:tetratricopeptide (TPR) repeat protein